MNNKINWETEAINIEAYLNAGKSVQEIARIYGVSTPLIYNKISIMIEEGKLNNIENKPMQKITNNTQKVRDWDLCNKVLNTARRLVGKELVPASKNPYISIVNN